MFKATTNSGPVLIVLTCVEIALGVAKLFAALIERPLIVSITALEASLISPLTTVQMSQKELAQIAFRALLNEVGRESPSTQKANTN